MVKTFEFIFHLFSVLSVFSLVLYLFQTPLLALLGKSYSNLFKFFFRLKLINLTILFAAICVLAYFINFLIGGTTTTKIIVSPGV
jgi:hypothetical protein